MDIGSIVLILSLFVLVALYVSRPLQNATAFSAHYGNSILTMRWGKYRKKIIPGSDNS
jgi:hypothetical protein